MKIIQLVLIVWASSLLGAAAQGALFTYQGLLKNGSTAAQGNYDFEFTIYDAGGVPVGGMMARPNVAVSNGVFTVLLDPNPDVFKGDPRWLGISVRPGGSGGGFTPLLPRQPITATPYASFALNSSASLNNIIRGRYPSVGGGLQNTTDGDFPTVGGGENNTAAGNHPTVGGGFRNVSAGPFATVGGGEINNAGGQWATVAGGNNNQSTGVAATIGGGQNNFSGDHAVVDGGLDNRADAFSATVGGGNANHASGASATIAGGSRNHADMLNATVGGGANNRSSGSAATVPGGESNEAAGDFSFAAGRRAKANHPGAFVWGDAQDGDFPSTGENQFLIRAEGGVGIGTTSPKQALHVNGDYYGRGHLWLHAFEGDDNSGTAYVQARDSSGFSSIGLQLRTQSSGTVINALNLTPGGDASINGNLSLQRNAYVGGNVEANGSARFANGNVTITPTGLLGIGTSQPQTLLHVNSFDNLTSLRLQSSQVLSGQTRIEFYVGGINAQSEWRPGYIESVGGWPEYNGGLAFFVNGSGFANRFGATEVMRVQNGSLNFGTTARQMINLFNSTYGIGVQDFTFYQRSDNGFAWFKQGAHSNTENDPGTGGTRMMMLGGSGELHVGGGAFAGLSLQNRETPNYVVTPGFGERWVWYASQGVCRLWSGSDKMTVDPNGFVTAAGFFPSSDRNAKENFKAVDSRAVLDKVVALPITRWNFKQDAGSEHIGPMAQDFHAAFGIGPDDKHIATVDADGVALAAIQGLNQKLEEKEARIAALERTIAELKEIVSRLGPVREVGQR